MTTRAAPSRTVDTVGLVAPPSRLMIEAAAMAPATTISVPWMVARVRAVPSVSE